MHKRKHIYLQFVFRYLCGHRVLKQKLRENEIFLGVSMICSIFACFYKMDFEKCWCSCWKPSLGDWLADFSYGMCQGESLWIRSDWAAVCMILRSLIWLTVFGGSTCRCPCHAQSSPVFVLFPPPQCYKTFQKHLTSLKSLLMTEQKLTNFLCSEKNMFTT